MLPNLLHKRGGFVSMDKVVERLENERWNIEVYDFQSWMLGYYKFTGEWKTKELEPAFLTLSVLQFCHWKILQIGLSFCRELGHTLTTANHHTAFRGNR